MSYQPCHSFIAALPGTAEVPGYCSLKELAGSRSNPIRETSLAITALRCSVAHRSVKQLLQFLLITLCRTTAESLHSYSKKSRPTCVCFTRRIPVVVRGMAVVVGKRTAGLLAWS